MKKILLLLLTLLMCRVAYCNDNIAGSVAKRLRLDGYNTFDVAYENGVEIGRTVVEETVVTEAVDRIYEDNNNEATQGKGSYMTYKATTNELTVDQVKGLMDCIRIVFFETGTMEIIGEARLDTANATIGADGVTAKMYMYKAVEIPVTDADGAPLYNEDGTAKTETTYVLQNGGKESDNKDSSIVALPQNKELAVSVLVYLDGDEIENADVAATDVKSVTGMMNIQFASDANLKPMEYGDLYTPNKGGSTEGNT